MFNVLLYTRKLEAVGFSREQAGTHMQMLSEIGIDNNTTTVILMPSEFTNAAHSFSELVKKKKELE